MPDNKLSVLSMNFAVDVLKLCDEIKRHYSLVNQLERSATSIGANIREANYAQSKPDFISKLQIALKECYETEYWLELLQKAEIVQTDNVLSLYHKCGEIRRILISSINTAKKNSKADRQSIHPSRRRYTLRFNIPHPIRRNDTTFRFSF
ncbi:MAG: four helix bundle protein [Clostridia bacterium]|nr:four helix bundle protein [Clostridia bacterium]